MSKVFTTRYRRQMESKLRSRDRQAEKKRLRKNPDGRFSVLGCPPLLVRFQNDTGKLPAGFPIQLPHDTAIAAIHIGRTVALPVGSFAVKPDLDVDENDLEHAGLEFAVA